ncbi:MAG: prolyl oligopeptidase family serine peptidase [Aquirufa sp.]
MKKIFLLLTVLLCSMGSLLAQFEKKEFATKDGNVLLYQILYPENYNPKVKYPVILFLHGAGERGNDNAAQLTHGSKLFLDQKNREKYPAIVIFPQCPKESFWSSIKIDRAKASYSFDFTYNEKLNWPTQAAVDLVKGLVKEKKADKKRLYIMGLSMGGMGTMEVVSRYPKMFAAAAPICGGADLSLVKKYAKKLPFWVFHGDADAVVPVDNSRKLVAALKELNADVKYSEYPGVNHNSWDNAFAEPEFLAWFFSHRK